MFVALAGHRTMLIEKRSQPLISVLRSLLDGLRARVAIWGMSDAVVRTGNGHGRPWRNACPRRALGARLAGLPPVRGTGLCPQRARARGRHRPLPGPAHLPRRGGAPAAAAAR